MSVAIEMEPLISLATLPPDIIRIIIDMDKSAIDEMKLVSIYIILIIFGIV